MLFCCSLDGFRDPLVKRRTSKPAAIKAALNQLGRRANAKDVAALLANYSNDTSLRKETS